MKSQELYRFISFESFMNLLITKEERYVRPIDCWEDTYEGYMLHMLDTNKGTREVLEIIYDKYSGNENKLHNTMLIYSQLLRARYACYGQSWSKVKDSDAMWRIYSYNKKAIQLVSEKDRIKNLFGNNSEKYLKLRIGDITYDDNVDVSIRKGMPATEPYFHKRDAFKHEEEVRVILLYDKHYSEFTDYYIDSIESISNKNNEEIDDVDKIMSAIEHLEIIEKFENPYRGFSLFPETTNVRIKELSDYIIGVRVHPQAENWYVNLIEKICEEYHIKFIGQSELYKKVI